MKFIFHSYSMVSAQYSEFLTKLSCWNKYYLYESTLLLDLRHRYKNSTVVITCLYFFSCTYLFSSFYHIVLCILFWLCSFSVVCPYLSVLLDCPFLVFPSIFSKDYLSDIFGQQVIDLILHWLYTQYSRL